MRSVTGIGIFDLILGAWVFIQTLLSSPAYIADEAVRRTMNQTWVGFKVLVAPAGIALIATGIALIVIGRRS